jgi:hypothetical protein
VVRVRLAMEPQTFDRRCDHRYVYLREGLRKRILVWVDRARLVMAQLMIVPGLQIFGRLCVYLHVWIRE